MDKSPMPPRAGGVNHPLGDQFVGLRDCPSIQQQVGIAVFIVAMGPKSVVCFIPRVLEAWASNVALGSWHLSRH